jgi:hypothetical protein
MTHIFWVTGLSPPHEKTNMRAFLGGLMGRYGPIFMIYNDFKHIGKYLKNLIKIC